MGFDLGWRFIDNNPPPASIKHKCKSCDGNGYWVEYPERPSGGSFDRSLRFVLEAEFSWLEKGTNWTMVDLDDLYFYSFVKGIASGGGHSAKAAQQLLNLMKEAEEKGWLLELSNTM